MDISQLLEALNIMLGENPRNSRKNAKVIQWFNDEVHEAGRASVVSEEKQVGNRISEQFKHVDNHVIFVYSDEHTKNTLIRRVPEFFYSDLKTVLILEQRKNNVDVSFSADLIVLEEHSKMSEFYKNEIRHLVIHDFIQHNAKAMDLGSVADVYLSKPFLLLAGISGTGKTRFIREQARLTGSIEDTYCLTSVRPDWHEPSDLLGYISRLSGNAEYIVTDVLKFIVKAWVEVTKVGVRLESKEAIGEKNQQEQIKPYWLCLDEMNLAPVEQYFADYLSVLETREWNWQGGNFTYKCDPLLKATVFDTVDKSKLKHELGLDGHDELWDHFISNGVGIPFNLIVAGTVNMDETTHGFSRKVIDRALTFDFGEFFPNDFDTFFEPDSEPKVLGYPVHTDGRNKAELSGTFDQDGSLSINFLKQINDILEHTPFKLAYRALNELLLFVITQRPQNELELQSVWDDFLMCKVLPRIEGDIDKLTKGNSTQTILEQLSLLLGTQLAAIWDTNTRQDLFRKSIGHNPIIQIECRSKIKLERMNTQLKNGFTSFWP